MSIKKAEELLRQNRRWVSLGGGEVTGVGPPRKKSSMEGTGGFFGMVFVWFTDVVVVNGTWI